MRHVKKREKKSGQSLAVQHGQGRQRSEELSAAVLKQTPKMEARGPHLLLKQAGGAHRAEGHSRHRHRNPSFILGSVVTRSNRYHRMGQSRRCYGNAGCSLSRPSDPRSQPQGCNSHDIIAQRSMWPVTRCPEETASGLRQAMKQRDVEQLQAAQLHEKQLV